MNLTHNILDYGLVVHEMMQNINFILYCSFGTDAVHWGQSRGKSMLQDKQAT